MKKLIISALVACAALAISACSQDDKTNTIKVAINSGPDQAIWQEVQKVAKDKYDLNVDVITFNDYVLPNEALKNKDVDVNAFQTVPYLEDQTKERGYKFVTQSKSFIFPIAAYSNKIKDIKELPNGATVAISNEVTTLGRSLLLLQAQGLIKLKEDVGYLPSTLDIIDNPHNIKFIEIDTPQLTRTLDDPQVYLSIINNNFSSQVGLSAARDGLFMEDAVSPYVNVILSREDNKDDEKVKNLIKAFQSPEIEMKANEVYKGDAIKAW